MQKLSILVFLFFTIHSYSQNIQGKVYDNESIISGVKVVNKTQNILVYTDTKGNFKIEASIKDSIVFSTLFHHEKNMIVSKTDFDDFVVIELKKAVNDLDEVLIKKEPDFKPFDAVETNTTLKNQILEDIKRNPHLYSPANNGNMDFIAIAKLIGKLFKSKKPKETIETLATYEDLVKLFETDAYFNDKFLKTELNIQQEYKFLFFQFCSAQSINSVLLSKENRFMLLDSLLKYSTEFMEIVNSDKKD